MEASIHPRHCRTAHFKRAWRHALVDVATLHDHFAVGKKFIPGYIGHAPQRGVDGQVAARSGVDVGGRCHRGFEVDQHFKWIEIDDHQIGGIFTLVGLFGDDDGDWFA